MSGWSRRLLPAALVILAACQPAGRDAAFQDYVSRLARVTGVAAEVPPARPLPPYPPRRALLVPIPRRTIDVAQFIDLNECGMGSLVGFRNSPLGRVQTASQRLGYETAWLDAAQRCGHEPWLRKLVSDKRRWLPSLFWNATFAGREIRVAMGAAAPPADGDLADLLRSLGDSYTRVEQGGFEVAHLERLLAGLEQGSWVGPARADWSAWRRYLDAGSATLRGAVPRICRNRQPNTTTRRLSNVFIKVYADRVQPLLARRMAEQEAWVTELSRLSRRLGDVAPAAWRTWYRAVLSPDRGDSEWQRTRRAVLDHVDAWKHVFAYCGIEPMPGLRQD